MALTQSAVRPGDYDAALTNAFGRSPVDPTQANWPGNIFMVPTLGCGPSMLAGAPHLDEDRRSSLNRLLCTYSAQLGVAHCIQLHVLSLWLLTELEEVQVYAIAASLVRDTRERAVPFLLRSHSAELAWASAFQELLALKAPSAAALLAAVPQGDQLCLFRRWMCTFFQGALPAEDVVRVLDCFLGEGPKVLLRFGVVMVSRALQGVSAPLISVVDLEAAVGAYVHGAGSSYSFARLVDEAFKVPSLSRKRVGAAFTRHHRSLSMASDMIAALVRDDNEPVAAFWRNPRFLGGSTILSIVDQDARAREVSPGGLVGFSAPLRRISLCVALSSQLTVMASALPRRLIQFDYSLLFASYHDERDLGHLYQRAAVAKGTLLLLRGQVEGRSMRPLVFGVYSRGGIDSGCPRGRAGEWQASPDGQIFLLSPDYVHGGSFSRDAFVKTTPSALHIGASLPPAPAPAPSTCFPPAPASSRSASEASSSLGVDAPVGEPAIIVADGLDTMAVSASLLTSVGLASLVLEGSPPRRDGSPGRGSGAERESRYGAPDTRPSTKFQLLEVELWGFTDSSGAYQ